MAAKTIPELAETTTLTAAGLIPVDSGIQSFKMTLVNLFKAGKAFLFSSSSQENTNISLSTSVASNALTIALKTKAGTDASATDPITVGFRNSTLTDGTYNTREITAALSLVISSGSTLGHVNAVASPIYVYLIDNAGTPELAVSTTLFDTGGVVTTVAEGGAGAADSLSVMYSTTARSSVPFRYIGKLLSTQTTAGTWAAAMSLVTTTALDRTLANSSIPGLTAPRKGQVNINSFVTCTASGWSPSRCVAIYYQDQDGAHRLKFNMAGTIGSKTLAQVDSFTISGLVFKNAIAQCVSCLNNGTKPWMGASVNSNSNTINLYADSSATVSAIFVSGDVELASKPSWA